MGVLTLVLGGSGSGKSEVAERMAASFGESVIYLATAATGDGEMRRRIERHRRRRPPEWLTEEETHALAKAVGRLGSDGTVLLVEDLTTWLANLLTDENWPRPSLPDEVREEAILAEVENLLAAVDRVPARVIVVSCEVGCGLVPAYPLGRAFRDLAGRANQMVACRAARVYMVMAGLTLALKE